ncbi:flavodoxin [Olsenella sp. YH-ols2217]|uniref:Flavodoxin n=1 Tax=Kribbibacterium absianum TaxID=3044210 RepID=A0ABT6ZI44_9ACTN|nr:MULTISPECIES: flavodoxin [unclassified Olsenella]MDJ1121231.1 flavodoxin [Olsenella sp. YH-ols2216]MDJ1128721.1 flavodoxin [Olsenella sp. YH-ols2217]
MGAVAVVYWSGKGNTEKMARLIARGAGNAGATVAIFEAQDFHASMLDKYDAVALGCPAMGVEQLEKTTFEPLMKSLDEHVAGRGVAVFGSFGFGVGEWIDTWEQRMLADGANLVATLKVNGEPEGSQEDRCVALGEQLARVAEQEGLREAV